MNGLIATWYTRYKERKKKMITPSDYTPKNNPPTDESLSTQLKLRVVTATKMRETRKEMTDFPYKGKHWIYTMYVQVKTENPELEQTAHWAVLRSVTLIRMQLSTLGQKRKLPHNTGCGEWGNIGLDTSLLWILKLNCTITCVAGGDGLTWSNPNTWYSSG